MMRGFRLLAVAIAAVALSACGAKLGGDEAAAHLRAINLIADSAEVRFSVDGTAVFSAGFESITGYNAVHVKTSTVQLSVPSASDLTGAVVTYANIGPGAQQVFAADKDYTLFAYGTVAAPQLFAVEAADQRSNVADNKVVWQIAHAAPGAGSLDVYLIAPEVGVNTPTFISNLNLGQATAPAELTFTSTDTTTLNVNLTLELRQPGTATVLYRSRPIQIAEQNRVLLTILDTRGPGPSTVEVLAVSGTSAVAGVRQPAETDNAEVRLAHSSVEAPALDLTNMANTLASNIAFGAASTHQSVPNGTLGLTGVETANTSNVLFVNNLSASPGTSYTLYATGPLEDISAPAFADERRSITGRTQFRFLHAASSLSGAAVNVYLTVPGAGLNLSANPVPAASVSSLGYRTVSAYQSLKPGQYDAYFVQVGATSALLGPVTLQLADGRTLTFALASAPGTSALTLLPFDDTRL